MRASAGAFTWYSDGCTPPEDIPASLQLLAGAVLPVGKGLLGGVIDQLGGKRSLRLLGLLEESWPLQQCVQQGTFAGTEMPHHKQLDFKMISQLFGQLKCVLKIRSG